MIHRIGRMSMIQGRNEHHKNPFKTKICQRNKTPTKIYLWKYCVMPFDLPTPIITTQSHRVNKKKRQIKGK